MHRNPRSENTVVPDAEEVSAEFDVESLLSKGGEILKREIRNLLRESANGKLSAGSARDLVAYLRLLSELKIEEHEVANKLSTDELEALAK